MSSYVYGERRSVKETKPMKLWHVWARKMYADGKSQAEIARALRKQPTTVRWTLDINSEQERHMGRVRAQRAKKRKRSTFSAEERAKRSARLKALWANPEFRAKKCAASSARLKAIHAAARRLAELETAAQ